MEKLLTIKEVADLLRTPSKKNKFIYDLARTGELPSAKIGNKILFKESDVSNYVNKQFRLQNQ